MSSFVQWEHKCLLWFHEGKNDVLYKEHGHPLRDQCMSISSYLCTI